MGPVDPDSELAERLRGVPVARLLEYCVAEIAIVAGEVTLEVVFADGRYRRGWVRAGPFSPDTLEQRRRKLDGLNGLQPG